MKIVVGGASSAGRSIVGYLSQGDNDIIVVDTNASKLDELAKEYDIQTVTGSISHPDRSTLDGNTSRLSNTFFTTHSSIVASPNSKSYTV